MTVLGFFLFLGACAGHMALLVYVLNWSYGHALPERFLGALRHIVIGLILLGPFALWWIAGLDLSRLAGDSTHAPWKTLLVAYIMACEVTGLLLVPLVTTVRLLRRPAAARHQRYAHDRRGRPPGLSAVRPWAAPLPRSFARQRNLSSGLCREDHPPAAAAGSLGRLDDSAPERLTPARHAGPRVLRRGHGRMRALGAGPRRTHGRRRGQLPASPLDFAASRASALADCRLCDHGQSRLLARPGARPAALAPLADAGPL